MADRHALDRAEYALGGVPPRDPSRYAWTDHFRYESVPDGRRSLADGMVGRTIEDGDDRVREGGRGKIKRRRDFGGVECVLVIPIGEAVVVTGWCEVSDRSAARDGDRWSEEDIRQLDDFAADRGDRRPPEDEWRG